MPVKNTIKTYVENGYYHLYNRGVDKRIIFNDVNDCVIFLYYLKLYLSPPEVLRDQWFPLTPRLLFKLDHLNLSNEIILLSFAIMPNHFHLQVKQKTNMAIAKLMRRLCTAYAQYFNRKHRRIGTLFESTYKAVLVETDEQNLYLSSYIHRNPMKLFGQKINFAEFSSFPYYLGEKRASWLNPGEILIRFNNKNRALSYESFVNESENDEKEALKELVLEDDY